VSRPGPFADPSRLRARANADGEFRIAARYWTATLSLESPPRALRVELVDGQVAGCDERAAGGDATITIVGPAGGWAEFLAPIPRPFYQDLLGGCVQHHGFTVGGDVLGLSAYYQAAQRLFAIMRELRAASGRVRAEGSAGAL
jgi:hypothetical protein